MQVLIPPNRYGILADKRGVAMVDSLFVAEAFEKRHSHVLRDIAKITQPKSGLSEEFVHFNFLPDTYMDATGRKLPRCLLTRDGFTILVMGYTGPKAMRFKELYIQRFNEMEACIHSLLTAREEFPLLTSMICQLHENPKPYHFSNECDMLNRIVLGKSAKQFRLENSIAKGQSIRPYLNQQQISALEVLQHLDFGLLYSGIDFQTRKQLLTNYYKTNLEG